VAHHLESRIGANAVEVRECAGDEIIDADDVMSLREKPFAQMRTDESPTAGDQCARHPRSSPDWRSLLDNENRIAS